MTSTDRSRRTPPPARSHPWMQVASNDNLARGRLVRQRAYRQMELLQPDHGRLLDEGRVGCRAPIELRHIEYDDSAGP